MSARIAHISDTHLGTRPGQGVRQNVWGVEMRARLLEHDFYDQFQEIFKRIQELDPPVDIVVHSGDLYNSPWEGNPLQPPVVAQETAIAVIQDFISTTGIPVLILEGNHGIYRSLKVSLLDTLKLAIPGLEIATQQDLAQALANEEPLVRSFEKLDVYCFPFMDPSVLKSADLMTDFIDWISTYQKPKSGKPSIAVSHGMDIDGSLYSPIFGMGYDYIALGHDHHRHAHAKNAWYAGSPEIWRFDESKHDKGFLVIDIDAGKQPKVTEMDLPPRRPVFNEKVKIEKDDNVDALITKIDDWMDSAGIKTDWDIDTAARVRFVFQGTSPRMSSLDIAMGLEAFRMKALSQDSGYNLAQLVWSIKHQSKEFDEAAYPEIVSEYLIEDPEEDFLAYLDTLTLDERYDPSKLTQIAVGALKAAVTDKDQKLTLDKILEDKI